MTTAIIPAAADLLPPGNWGHQDRGGGSLVPLPPVAVPGHHQAVAVPWSHHNGALKYFRDCVLTEKDPSKVLNTDELVQRVVHGKDQDYSFGDWGRWDWQSFVAAMSPEEHKRFLVDHPIIAVAVERRPNPYDQYLAAAAKRKGWKNFCP